MNRKELQGLSFLTIFIVVIWFLPSIYSYFMPAQQSAEFARRETEIRNFLAKNTDKGSMKVDQDEGTFANHRPIKPSPEYFSFNPNDLKTDDGQRLGLSDYQIRMIQNYVSKGGKFSKREDFARIYSITEEDFQRLLPYINIPEKARQANVANEESRVKESASFASPQKAAISIELNSTDSIELQQLHGIGPVFASRIIRFRDLLGNFHDKSQLLQVYGMDEERYSRIQHQLFVDTTRLEKININAADYQRLVQHPHITSKLANVIVHYRNQHGNYSRPEDLLKIAIVNEDFLRKIAPYLTFVDD